MINVAKIYKINYKDALPRNITCGWSIDYKCIINVPTNNTYCSISISSPPPCPWLYTAGLITDKKYKYNINN